MTSAERSYERARRRALRILTELGDEIHTARLMAGASQTSVATAARLSRSTVSRIEAAKLLHVSVLEAVVLADAVGLDVSFKAYPGRSPTRDTAQAKRLQSLLGHVGRPLRHATEVPLPRREGAPEQRAWDAMLYAPDGETGVELEQRLYDIQAQMRRILLKWRDSGAERLLLVIADTDANRRVLRTFPEYFSSLPRLKRSTVIAQLEAGVRPETGYVLF
jgi:transcriptional regulator with XRE-family HTH domain